MIKVLKYVYDTLVADSEVSALVGTDVFPNIIPDTNGSDQVRFPNIVMTRLSLSPEYTKMIGCSVDTAAVEVVCWSESYFTAVDLAHKVREALDFSTGDLDGKNIQRVRLDSADEGFADVAYYQRLVFTLK